jgi:hypothetical protein
VQAVAKGLGPSMRLSGKVEALATLRNLMGCGVSAALKGMQGRYKYFRDHYQMRLELIGKLKAA